MRRAGLLALWLLVTSCSNRAARSVPSVAPTGAPTAAHVDARPIVQRFAAGALPVPEFVDPNRKAKLGTAFPEIDKIFGEWREKNHVPGLAVGVVIDGELAWSKGYGVRDVTTSAPVDDTTQFRIASMSKSFTAMAILELRDQGKLALDDPAVRYVPELANLEYPTRDSPLITLRHLLTHSAGFPEDNPSGDRLLAMTDDEFGKMISGGFPFSHAPGTAFEYANLGFELLGRVGLQGETHATELLGDEDGVISVKAVEAKTGFALTHRIKHELFDSQEYRQLARVHAQLIELAGTPAFEVRLGDVSEQAPTFEALRSAVMTVAQKGVKLQRFKGLGEMNAEQLGETTMAPATRTLAQVTLEDAFAADRIFSMLMGDQVEPRRAFIEDNARAVANLDV